VGHRGGVARLPPPTTRRRCGLLATPALVVVITVALVTLVALGLTLVYLLHHLRSLTGSLTRMQDRLQPTLERLADDAAVTQAELERVSAAAERLGRHDGAAPTRPSERGDGRHGTATSPRAPDGTWDE
jgi:hypothetical protein